MKIGIDLDDCINDLLGSFIMFHNERYGTKLIKKDFHCYRYNEVLGISLEEAGKRVMEFYLSPFYDTIVPMPEAMITLYQLKNEGHELAIVTGRPSSVVRITRDWVEKNSPYLFSDIYHTNAYDLDGLKISKSHVCVNLGIKTIIDDDLMHVVDCASFGIKVLVPNRFWNQGVLPTNATRFHDWNKVSSLI